MLRNNRMGRIMMTAVLCAGACVFSITGCGDSKESSNVKNGAETEDTQKKTGSGNNKINPDKPRNGKNGDSDTEASAEDNTDLFGEKESELLLNTDVLKQDKDDTGATGKIKEIVEAGRGDYTHKLNAMAEIYYLDKYYETVRMPDIKFVKYKVEAGDYVKRGDTIFTYKAEVDEMALRQMESDIVQKEKDYTAGYDSRKAEISKAKHELKTLKEADEIKLKKLEIKKLEQALKEFSGTKSDLKKLKEELAEYKSGAASTRMTASHEGYILSLEELQKGDVLVKGRTVAVISPKKEYYVQVEDISEGRLRYNSEVEVSVDGGNGEKKKTMKGKVIAASNLLAPDHQQQYAYVSIIDEPEGVNWDNPIKISYTGKELKNVLMIPRDALCTETSGEGKDMVESDYVYIYENDHAYKRYVDVYDDGGDQVVIIQGVNEGQKVVVYEDRK